MKELKSFILKQQYPEKLCEPRQKHYKKYRRENSRPSYFLRSTHNPKNPEIYKIIQFNLPILHEDPKMNSKLSNFKIIKSKRQPNTRSVRYVMCIVLQHGKSIHDFSDTDRHG